VIERKEIERSGIAGEHVMSSFCATVRLFAARNRAT
jgi:hypothetical protein